MNREGEFCGFLHHNLPPMSRSLYKDTLDFFKRCSKHEVKGNHLRRLKMLSSMVVCCAQTRSSSLSSLGSGSAMDIRQSESRIKQAKRWLSSKWTDWDSFFAPYIHTLLLQLAKSGELVLVIDGSQTAQGCCTLMLSVIWKKYAIPVVWLTKEAPKGHFSDELHTDLVSQFHQFFHSQQPCRIVLLGDGEFDGSLLRNFCQRQNWEYVLRTSVDRQIDFNGEVGRIDALLPLLQSQESIFIEHACLGSHAVLWKGKNFQDPIAILTNMELGPMACQYYRRRFKIETMFKQFKSAGFQLQKSRLGQPVRVQNLIIVVAIAFIFTFCIGLLLKEQNHKAIAPFLRVDSINKMSPITIAQKAIAHHSDIAYYIFSMLSKNFENFFST